MKENLRMQFLAGLITESEYKQLLEYSKSQREFILLKLNSPKSSETDALFNSLNQQGITYQDIKKQIEDKTIKSFEDLKKLKTISKSDIKKQSKLKAEKLLDNEDFLIIQPNTYESNCYYGSGTKWCTTASEKEKGRERFESYSEDSPMIFVIDKSKSPTDPLHKVAFSRVAFFNTDRTTGEKKWNHEVSVWNAEDDEISKTEYLKYLQSKGVDTKKIFKL